MDNACARPTHRAVVALCAMLAVLIIPAAAFAGSDPTAPDGPPPTDTSFSLAVIPDTQLETHSLEDTRFLERNEWLVANRDDLDLRFVAHTGDVVDWGWLDPVQYQVADQAMQVLDQAGIPYSLSVGNHDTRFAAVGGSAYTATPECKVRFGDGCWSVPLLRATQEFNSVFPPSRLRALEGAFEAGKVDNTYSTFSAGGVDWLMLSLEMYPRAGVIAWAQAVLEQHPDRNVVISTHHYLDGDGSINNFASFGLATSPQELYNQLISRYSNIKLVLSAHTGQTASRVDVGVNGNRIVSLLTSIHSTTANPVRLVTFDTATNSLSTWIESPRTNSATTPETFTDLSFVSPPAPETPTDSPTDAPTDSPTDQPTEVPTDPSTDAAGESPTDAPTYEPNESPTDVPTVQPTVQPTDQPTDEPVGLPTVQPTGRGYSWTGRSTARPQLASAPFLE